jgi:hypothetical protein
MLLLLLLLLLQKSVAAEECGELEISVLMRVSVLLTLGFLYWVGVWTWQTLLERLDSKEWLVVCEALTHTRQLSIFHTKLLLPIL